MESTQNKQPVIQQNQPAPKVPMYIIAILITLGVLSIVLGIILFNKTTSLTQTQEEKEYIEVQKIKVESELNELIVGYDSLKTTNDSINGRLNIEQDKIRRLLRVQASNVQKLDMYEKELGTLRKIMRNYIVQIDSLNTRNRELTEENVAVRTELRQKEVDYQELSVTKEELSTKVAYAQKLIAKNILVEGLNARSKAMTKSKKVEKIRVCFTIRENNIANSGNKMIYIQIIRPDEVVLSSPEAGMFQINNESKVYSSKRELEYDNMDIDMCIYWDTTEELIPGIYNIGIYAEGYEIGTSTLELK
jgi:hypothetical protein